MTRKRTTSRSTTPRSGTGQTSKPVRPLPVPVPKPATDLTTLAGQIPSEILQHLATAIQSGHWLFAVWHVSDGQIYLERTAVSFPTADLDNAVQLLAGNVQELKAAQ